MQLRTDKRLGEAKLPTASGMAFRALDIYDLGVRKPSLAPVVKIAKTLG